MVYVKVVENKEIGKVILPAYFPIGVLAKRFGYLYQVPTDSHTRLTDVDAYLVLDEGKLVMKSLEEQDKEGFLQSFAARIEEKLEATNNFTLEHAIFPKDIFWEADLEEKAEQKEAKPSQPSSSAPSRTPEPAPAPLSVRTLDQPAGRLDASQIKEGFTREQAAAYLEQYLNSYLAALSLKKLDQKGSDYPLGTLAVRGKGLLTYAVAERFPKLAVLEMLLSQESIQLALGRLGFYEFLEVDAQLAAVFFQALYACAAIQGRHEVRRQMEEILTGSHKARLDDSRLTFEE